MLSEDTIPFGKYSGMTLDRMLRDRGYCKWVLAEPWFKEQYSYLYTKTLEYNPGSFFYTLLPSDSQPLATENFITDYPYFNLNREPGIELSQIDKTCYDYYLQVIDSLKNKILVNLENPPKKGHPFDIKAPTNWLQVFETTHTHLSRENMKEFLSAYELPNIVNIVEDIKKVAGIEYKGAKSFLIAKANSKTQEAYWGALLRTKFGDDLGTQFKWHKCIFDYLHIKTKTIYECKLGFKDLLDDQYNKYVKTLGEFNVVFLIGYDTIVNMGSRTITSCIPVDFGANFIETRTKLLELMVEFEIKMITKEELETVL